MHLSFCYAFLFKVSSTDSWLGAPRGGGVFYLWLWGLSIFVGKAALACWWLYAQVRAFCWPRTQQRRAYNVRLFLSLPWDLCLCCLYIGHVLTPGSGIFCSVRKPAYCLKSTEKWLAIPQHLALPGYLWFLNKPRTLFTQHLFLCFQFAPRALIISSGPKVTSFFLVFFTNHRLQHTSLFQCILLI